MNSPEPKSWQQLTTAARQSPTPVSVDVRVSVRREIERVPRGQSPVSPGMMDDLAALFQAAWIRGALALLMAVGGLACWHGLDAACEIAWIYELRGAAIAGIPLPLMTL